MSVNSVLFRYRPEEYFQKFDGNLDAICNVVNSQFQLMKSCIEHETKELKKEGKSLSEKQIIKINDEIQFLESVVKNAKKEKKQYYKSSFLGAFSAFLSNVIAKITFGQTPRDEANKLLYKLVSYRHITFPKHSVEIINKKLGLKEKNLNFFSSNVDKQALCFTEAKIAHKRTKKGGTVYFGGLDGGEIVIDNKRHANFFATQFQGLKAGATKEFKKGIDLDKEKLVGKLSPRTWDDYEEFEKDEKISRYLADLGMPQPKVKVSTYQQMDPVIIAQYCSEGTLKEFLANNQNLPKTVLVDLMLQIAKSLEIMHKKGNYIHSDIKLENILINKKGDKYQAFLIDFDVSCKDVAKKDEDNLGGTCLWLSPQRYLDAEPTAIKKDDIWSLGLLFSRLLFPNYSHPLFELEKDKKLSKEALILEVYKVMLDLKEAWWDPPGDHTLKSLIVSMLYKSSEPRPTIDIVCKALIHEQASQQQE